MIGSHNTKFGGEFGWSQWDSKYVPSGGFSFTGNETGNAVADFLLGAPVLVRQPSPEYDIANTRFGGAMLRTVGTLDQGYFNYGLRWQVALPWYGRTIDSPLSYPASSPPSFPRRRWDLCIPVTRVYRAASRPRGGRICSQSWLRLYSDDQVKCARSIRIFFTADDTFSSFFAGSPPPYQIFYVSPSPNLLDYPYTIAPPGSSTILIPLITRPRATPTSTSASFCRLAAIRSPQRTT